MKILMTIIVIGFMPTRIFGQTLYRSAGSGDWSATSTWEVSTDNGASWAGAGSAPTNSNCEGISILSGHTVTVTASVTVDQVTVEAGGQVTINSGISWTIDSGTGVDLTVNGTVLNKGSSLFTVSGPTWVINDGGAYIHNTTSGITTPLDGVTLSSASNFIYRGSSSVTPAVSVSGRTYGNLSFESSSGSWSKSVSGSNPLTINGDFVIGSGVTYNTSQTGTMTYAGNFTMNGTLTNSTGTQVYTFTGTGKSIGGSGSITLETWNISSGASITLSQNVAIDAGFLGTVSGTLNCGAYVVSGSGDFTLASGGTLGIGSADGITSSAASGNIQVTGTRTYSTSANYIYNGSSAQSTGDGLPTTINDLTVSNTSGVVTTSQTTTISDDLSISTGAELRVGTSLSLTCNGDATVNGTLSGGNGSSSFTFYGPTFTNGSTVSIATLYFDASTDQSIAGTGSWTCTTLYIGWSNAHTVSLSNALTLDVATLVVSGGSTLSLGTYDLTFTGSTISNSGTISGTGTLKINDSPVTISNGGTLSAPLQILTGTTTANGTFGGAITVDAGTTLQVLAGGSMTASANVTVNGTLSGGDGSSAFTFNGSTFTNNSPVSVATFTFDALSGQSIIGTGSWTCTTLYIGWSNAPTVSLSNALILDVATLVVSGGSTLSLGTYDLTFTGSSISNSGTISGTGTLKINDSPVTISNGGTLSAPLQILTGTTTANGTFGGAITVDAGTTLQVLAGGSMTASANVTVNGTLSGGDGSSAFTFNGSTFTNNSPVSVATFTFDALSGQSIIGTGSWTCTTLYIGWSNAPTVSLSNALTLDVATLVVSGGSTLNLGTYNLTFTGSSISNSGTISGTGALKINDSPVTISNGGTLSAPLQILTGTTTANGTFDGAITVDAGTTLQVLAGGSMTANANVTVNGTLSGGDGSSAFTFSGSTFTNNSPVTVTNFYFGTGAQTLAGDGTFSSNTVTILSGSAVTVTGDPQMSAVVINSGGTLNITSRTFSLSASGTPLTNDGTFTTTGSTIVYNGVSGQTIATSNIDYVNLTINNASGVTLSASETVTGILTLTNGTLSGAGNLTLGNGATIKRATGVLSGTPTFGTSVNVEYIGAAAVSSGSELPSSSSVLNNLTMNKSGGVTVTSSPTVNGTFTLTDGDFSIGTNTLTLNDGVTRTGGSLTSAATGTVIYNQSSNGQAVIPGSYGNLTFSNYNKTLPSSGTVAIAGTFTPGTATGHTITGSTIEYNGGASQSLPSGFTPYNNLVLNNTAGTSGFSGLTVNTLIRVQSGTFTTASTFTDVQIDAGATLEASSGSTITVEGNWTNDGTFTPGTGTVVFAGSSPQSTGGSSSTSFNNLTVDNGANLTMNIAASVSGTLTFTSGKIILGSADLTLGSSASVSGESSSRYVQTGGTGGLVRTVGSSPTLFPIGPSSSYNPVTLTNSGSTDAFRCRVKTTFDNAPNDANKVVNRQWTIEKIGSAIVNIAMALQWIGSEEAAGFVRTDPIYIGRYTGSVWQQEAASFAGSDPYTATASGFTSFSNFGVGNNAALPVELTSFSASYRNGNVHLKWKTATETNNYGFEIHRSENLVDWETLGFVAGAGTSNTPMSYEFSDALSNTIAKQLYYRLKQIDRDGSAHESHVVSVAVNKYLPSSVELSPIHPNPALTSFTIPFTVPEPQKVQLTVHDAFGREVTRIIERYERGSHSISIATGDLVPGWYIVRLQAGTDHRVATVMVVR